MKELLEAAKAAFAVFEKQARQNAIDANIGISEWKAFLPKAAKQLQIAIKKAEKETDLERV